MKIKIVLGVVAVVLACPSFASSYQCMNDTDKSIRNIAISGDLMTVVNPETPRIVFTKKSDKEARGTITRWSNDAWDFYDKEGIGSLTNKVFGDKYGCIQTGQ